MIGIQFQHWHYQFSSTILNHCSSYRKKNETESLFYDSLKSSAIQKEETKVNITEQQVLYANEVFPEAAIVNPLEDLRCWETWRSGAKIYPYPGKYARLSINNQLPKNSSPSSVGVLGEIIAGIIGQAIISPNIVTRVINRWPDFIFCPINKRYSFLEAKAFSQRATKEGLCSKFKMPKDLIKEALHTTAKDLLLDRSLKIWYSFTEIKSISPSINLVVNFFEFECEEYAESPVCDLPCLIEGLAEQAIQRAIYKIVKSQDYDIKLLSKGKSNRRDFLEKELIKTSKDTSQEVIEQSFLKKDDINSKKLEEHIINQVKKLKLTEWETDKDWILRNEFIEPKDEPDQLSSKVYQLNVSLNEQWKLNSSWKSSPENVVNPYQLIIHPNEKLETEIWRYGSRLFFSYKTKEELNYILESLN